MMTSPANLFRRGVEPTGSGSRCVPPTRQRNWWRREDGSTLIEFAVTLPTLFALIFVFIEICLMFYTYEMISMRARQGTRYAMVRGASCPTTATPTCMATKAQVEAYVSGLTWPNVGGGTVSPNATYLDGDEVAGHHVQVKVTYTYHVMLPFVPNKSFSLSSTSVATIIQ